MKFLLFSVVGLKNIFKNDTVALKSSKNIRIANSKQVPNAK